MIETASLQLTPCKMMHVEALQRGEQELAGLLSADPEPGWLQFPESIGYVKNALENDPDAWRWGMMFLIYRAENKLIGVGGFKAAPDGEGMVEIGYSIADAFRRRGLATEAARGMVDHAFADPRIQCVDAHTLAEWNPSTRILQKVGMLKIAEKNDPEDGDIWQWRIRRAEYLR